MQPRHLQDQSGAVVDGAQPIADAAARMRFHDVASVAVRDEHGDVVGFITERDIVRAVADGADTLTTPVGEYATLTRLRS